MLARAGPPMHLPFPNAAPLVASPPPSVLQFSVQSSFYSYDSGEGWIKMAAGEKSLQRCLQLSVHTTPAPLTRRPAAHLPLPGIYQASQCDPTIAVNHAMLLVGCVGAWAAGACGA